MKKEIILIAYMFFCLLCNFGCINPIFKMADSFDKKASRLHLGQNKNDVLEILGIPDWQGSGRNTIKYYDKKNKQILEIDFDQKSNLINYRIINTTSFPDSALKAMNMNIKNESD